MEWNDQGIVLSTKPHGETSVVLELFTAEHGRHAGLVRGGRSKRNRPILQPGNLISVTWRARLAEHLGNYTVELVESHAAQLMEDRVALTGVNTLCTLAHLLPERQPEPGLYGASMFIFDYIEQIEIWPSLLVRWELELLNELGFGLDLSECAATGSKDDLIYVSPKSGRAVSREAGEPYKDRLLKIPTFLMEGRDKGISTEGLRHAFELTGFFLEKHIFSPRGQSLPEPRKRLISYLNLSD